MFKRVDGSKDSIEGFSYVNKDGDEEYVRLEENCVDIVDGISKKCHIYYEDILNLIKALQSAYDYKKGNE